MNTQSYLDRVTLINYRYLDYMKLTQEHISLFYSQGFLVIENALTDSDFQPVIQEINQFIDTRAKQLKEQEKIDNLYKSEPFEKRFAYIFSQYPAINEEMDIM